MTVMLLLPLLLQAAPVTEPAPDPSQDIVVVAVRPKRCNLAIGDRELSWGQVDDLSQEWGVGRPIRVLAPRSLSTKCMMKIMFKLADRGFKYVHFVDPAAGTSQPVHAEEGLSNGEGPSRSTGAP